MAPFLSIIIYTLDVTNYDALSVIVVALLALLISPLTYCNQVFSKSLLKNRQTVLYQISYVYWFEFNIGYQNIIAKVSVQH